MILASAQVDCTTGKIENNLQIHYKAIQQAIQRNANLILFPELSITGYCRSEALELAFSTNDSRLDELQKLSKEGGIIIIAGAPIQIANKLYIGSFIINPDTAIQIYLKHYLHEGEELYYSPSLEYNPILNIENHKISLAICADINNEAHPQEAQRNNTSIYLASIFYSDHGILKGLETLQGYAKKYSMNVIMSNYSGENWNLKGGGKSSFWDSKGELKKILSGENSNILFIDI